MRPAKQEASHVSELRCRLQLRNYAEDKVKKKLVSIRIALHSTSMLHILIMNNNSYASAYVSIFDVLAASRRR
jgi:hypothetical protein